MSDNTANKAVVECVVVKWVSAEIFFVFLETHCPGSAGDARNTVEIFTGFPAGSS